MLIVALGFAVLCIVSCGCCRVGSVDLVAGFLELRVFCRFGRYCVNRLFSCSLDWRLLLCVLIIDCTSGVDCGFVCGGLIWLLLALFGAFRFDLISCGWLLLR